MVHINKQRALTDIRLHLRLSGSTKWASLRNTYAAVSEATWWRWVRRAKAQIGSQGLRAKIKQGIGSIDGTLGDRPGGIVYGGLGRLDYLGSLHQQFADAEKLRLRALNADGSVRDPNGLDRAIRVRLKLLSRSVKLEARIYAVKQVQKFYDALLAEIAQESPDLQRRIANRLTVLLQGPGHTIRL